MNKKFKKIVVIVLIILAVIALIFFVRFIIGGSEDTWICSAGECVKHGNPTAPMPNKSGF
jgi:uncharacterized membrane protein YqiK